VEAQGGVQVEVEEKQQQEVVALMIFLHLPEMTWRWKTAKR
jgi:hypothetical protein